MTVRGFIPVGVAIALAAVLPAASCGENRPPVPEARPSSATVLRTDWGIRVEGLRLSANGYMVDFRYEVLNPEKAMALGSREYKPYLIDEATGARLLVPNTPKVGPLRPSAHPPVVGKTYWMLFSNPGKLVKAGNQATVVIGDFRAEHLKVE